MDVTGIVALVLAAGGAAYLVRARMLVGRVEAPKTGVAREAATLPPTLRPKSDRPPTKKKSKPSPSKPPASQKAPESKIPSSKQTAPATPVAKAEADAAISKRAILNEAITPIAKEKDDDSGPSTKPEERESESRAAVTTPPKADSKPPASVPLEVRLAPLVESSPKIAPSAVTVPAVKFNKKATIVGVAPVARGAAPTPAPEKPAPAPVPIVDVPRLDTDEDEDVEPTRVGRYERQSIRPPIEKHVFDDGADGDKSESQPLSLAVFALAQTHPGKRRKQNEDSYLLRAQDGVFVVADGMGGHRGGEFASKIAVDTIDAAFEKKEFDAEAHADLPPAASELARAIQMANAAILAEANAKPELKGMGTTLCATRFTEGNRRLFVGHVGDSRCYRVRGGSMKQMTTDHTMADYGVTGPEGAHLSRALGVWPTVPIDVIMATPELDDVYLICSDGLTKMLTHETIQTQLLHEEDPKAAVERLVFFANAHGGKDNITVILLRVIEPGWMPPSERAALASSDSA